MRILALILVLFLSASAQEYPVEVNLVPPPVESGITFTVLTAPEPKGPAWTPPPRPCKVCQKMETRGMCPCDEPLTQSLAIVLLDRVRKAVSKATAGRIELAGQVRIRAVTSRTLRQMGGERLLGLYQDGVIWISYDLNRRQATAVIAHELGHAWFFQNRPDVETPNELLFEGFAEWVSFLALKELGDLDGAAKIEYADQSVYGRGARKLIARQRREGLDAVLQLALRGRGI